jgi:hypothetical protein
MGYERQHASALRMLKAKGTAVTFSKTVPGTHDAATDTYTSPSTTTVPGYAVEVQPKSILDVERYRALSLVPGVAPTLEFVPTTFGGTPELGATASWAGHTVTVRDIVPVQPDGTPILFRLVVSR